MVGCTLGSTTTRAQGSAARSSYSAPVIVWRMPGSGTRCCCTSITAKVAVAVLFSRAFRNLRGRRHGRLGGGLGRACLCLAAWCLFAMLAHGAPSCGSDRPKTSKLVSLAFMVQN